MLPAALVEGADEARVVPLASLVAVREAAVAVADVGVVVCVGETGDFAAAASNSAGTGASVTRVCVAGVSVAEVSAAGGLVVSEGFSASDVTGFGSSAFATIGEWVWSSTVGADPAAGVAMLDEMQCSSSTVVVFGGLILVNQVLN